jgi:hypothetical protein
MNRMGSISNLQLGKVLKEYLVTIRPIRRLTRDPRSMGKFEYPRRLMQKKREYLHPINRALRVTIADPKMNRKKLVAKTSSAWVIGTCRISVLWFK